MTTHHHRRLRRTLGALSAVALAALTTAGPAAAAGAVGSAPTLPAADQPSTWWYDAMGYGEIHRGGTGKGITVAMLDTPIDPDAAEIKGKVASAETLCNVNVAPATAHGIEADHATNIAALMVGTGDGTNGRPGLRGIAPGITLRSYTVGASRTDGGALACSGDTDEVEARTLDKAVADGARVVSLTTNALSGPQGMAALGRAQRAGVILVAATDDHNASVGSPGSANGVVAVNYVDRHAKLSPKAVQGPSAHGEVTIAAPGVGLQMGGHEGSRWVSQGFGWSGSSFAAPLVAGGLAAVWSKFPHATANQILQLMVHTPGLRRGSSAEGGGWFYAFRRPGGPIPQAKQSGGGFGWGIFDPADMMRGDPSKYPDENPSLLMSNDLQPRWSDVTGKPLPAAGATRAPASPAPAAAPPVKGARAGSAVTWVLVAAGVVALAAVAVIVVVLTKRGRGAGATARTQEGN